VLYVHSQIDFGSKLGGARCAGNATEALFVMSRRNPHVSVVCMLE
jgi:hypothetical protein